MYKRSAIALMVTLFFIIAITVTIGVGLSQSSQATKEVNYHNFILQTSVILDDVVEILQNSSELELIVEEKSIEALHLFLSQAGIIRFENSGVEIIVKLGSARSKFNVNSLLNIDNTKNVHRVNALASYLSNYNLNSDYINILLDNMSEIKEDLSYNSDIFDEYPYLFRDYIVSEGHLEQINRFYANKYNENSLSGVDFKELLYFSKERETNIDLNYATKETWRLLLGCDDYRANELYSNSGDYASLVDLSLSEGEKDSLDGFRVSYFEPFLNIDIEIRSGSNIANINFEYDMIGKRGYDFVYEI